MTGSSGTGGSGTGGSGADALHSHLSDDETIAKMGHPGCSGGEKQVLRFAKDDKRRGMTKGLSLD